MVRIMYFWFLTWHIVMLNGLIASIQFLSSGSPNIWLLVSAFCYKCIFCTLFLSQICQLSIHHQFICQFSMWITPVSHTYLLKKYLCICFTVTCSCLILIFSVIKENLESYHISFNLYKIRLFCFFLHWNSQRLFLTLTDTLN